MGGLESGDGDRLDGFGRARVAKGGKLEGLGSRDG